WSRDVQQRVFDCGFARADDYSHCGARQPSMIDEAILLTANKRRARPGLSSHPTTDTVRCRPSAENSAWNGAQNIRIGSTELAEHMPPAVKAEDEKGGTRDREAGDGGGGVAIKTRGGGARTEGGLRFRQGFRHGFSSRWSQRGGTSDASSEGWASPSSLPPEGPWEGQSAKETGQAADWASLARYQ
ncbi:hypothetical protein FIBSPDRAFT_878616, partial [Athelia psychrophila]